MGGHEDGVIAFGRSIEEAGQTLLTWLARAYELEMRIVRRVPVPHRLDSRRKIRPTTL